MVDHRDRILAMARNAPLLPAQVAKALKTNTLLASAMLSAFQAHCTIEAWHDRLELQGRGIVPSRVLNMQLAAGPTITATSRL